MKKEIVLTAVITSIITSAITVFASGPGSNFPDVTENAYYADAVLSMRNMGVISGYENGKFGPDDYVTRGQLAAMFDRYNTALLNPPGEMNVSGVRDLQTVMCYLDAELANEGAAGAVKAAYDRACAAVLNEE